MPSRSLRARARALLVAPIGLLLFAAGALGLHAASLGPLAPRLTPPGSVRVLDRFGHTLADVRGAEGELAVPVRLSELSPWVVPALLAAEDQRFFQHPGFDPLAMLRALGQALQHGRVVSGASTITQQLARTLFERPRTLAGKWTELAHALRLEAELDKAAILEAYLERVSFGPRLRGIEAAARHYFDKPAAALSLGEAAALVALVVAPSRLDPARFPGRLERRRDQVLERMRTHGLALPDAVERAQRARLALHRGHVLPGAFHFVRAAVGGKLGPLPAPRAASAEPAASGVERPSATRPAALPATLPTTLDGGMQAEIEGLVRAFDARFAEHRASAASVVVLDNATASVRAYVGSPDHRAEARLGQNDGVLALRQPGSTLKPFVYALALSELGLTPASLLSDLEQRFASAEGDYVPYNYDRRFHGPVRLGQALAASLNVPAVALAERLGPERVLELLRQLGFAHLDRSGAHYGPAIALGVAEVQLLELAAAYAALGRGGDYLPPRFFEGAPVPAPRRALPRQVAQQILGVLADPRERAATFGRDGPLEFDVPVAVKTGTSKGNRDNWVVGVSADLSVAVWVGNFDATPMLRSSGATGAGPLFHEVMAAALRRGSRPGRPAPLPGPPPADAERVWVCAASGQLAGPDCPYRLELARGQEGDAFSERCRWHSRRCPPDDAPAECPLIEVIPSRYVAWAHESGRLPSAAGAAQREDGTPPRVPRRTARLPLLPRAMAGRASLPPDVSPPPASARAAAEGSAPEPPRIVFPVPRQRFVIDPNVSFEQRELVLRAQAAADARLSFVVDGAVACEAERPFECPWLARAGRHELIVRSDSGASAQIAFEVE